MQNCQAAVETMRARFPLRMLVRASLMVTCLVLIIRHWPMLSLGGRYFYHLVTFMAEDPQRFDAETRLLGETTWRLHDFEMNFTQSTCASRTLVKKKVAWLTAMVNDDFVVPAIALSYILKKLSCYQERVVMVSTGVSKPAQEALKKAGYVVEVVKPMDCDYMDELKGRPKSGKGILGTHTRLQAWNLTKYDTIVYMDADFLPLTNMDELFTRSVGLSAPYCGRPGIVDPCFNAGLLVFHPLSKTFQDLMEYWMKVSDYTCPNDQVLLWHFYADRGLWDPLPYAYDVRRVVHFPMKAYHFACCLRPKPWHYPEIPDRNAALSFAGPIDDVDDFATIWWRHFYRAIDEFHLEQWWSRTQKALERFRKHSTRKNQAQL